MSDEFIEYHGVQVPTDWPALIEQAQLHTTWDLLNGSQVPRVRYGSEAPGWGNDSRSCDACSVGLGQFHVPGCDLEQCPLCRGQLIGCECPYLDADDGTAD